MNAEDFRRIALEMQGAYEGAHMGHADFRIGGHIFATLYPQSERRDEIRRDPPAGQPRMGPGRGHGRGRHGGYSPRQVTGGP